MEQPSKFQHQLQPDMPSSSTMSTSPHPEQTPPWGALWVLALGLAMIVLDSSIVNVSIPTIIDDIGIDLTDAQWVTSLYNIVLAALLLPFGKLGDAKGRKLVFQIGTVIFVASSLLAAISQDAGMLLTARALQGIGGAMIMPNTLSTVSATFRGKYRAAAFGVWGARTVARRRAYRDLGVAMDFPGEPSARHHHFCGNHSFGAKDRWPYLEHHFLNRFFHHSIPKH